MGSLADWILPLAAVVFFAIGAALIRWMRRKFAKDSTGIQIERRTALLIRSVVLGLCVVLGLGCTAIWIGGFFNEQGTAPYDILIRIAPLVIMLAGSLPTSYTLWRFRTQDVSRTQDLTDASNNIASESNNFKSSEDAAVWLHSEKPDQRGAGLVMLARLRKLASDDTFTQHIDQVIKAAFLSTKGGHSIMVSSAKLDGLDLERVQWQESYLDKVELSNTILTWANLSGSRLIDVNLVKTNLKYVAIDEAGWENCRFEDVDMSYGNLADNYFQSPEFIRTQMIGGNYAGATFAQATFNNVDAHGTKENGPIEFSAKVSHDFAGAQFFEATLYDVDFSHRFFGGAHFQEGQLEEVRFVGANLTEVDFSTATLVPNSIDFDGANINGAKLPYASKADALKAQPSLAQAKGVAIYLVKPKKRGKPVGT